MPQIGETMRASNWYLDRDGCKGTNIAVALGRLGAQNILITRVGDDAWADLCTRWLTDAGVDTSFVLRDSVLETSTGVVFIDRQGRNSIVLSNSDNSVPHDLIDRGMKAADGCELFVTGFEIEERDALYAMDRAKECGMTAIINPSPVPADHCPDLSKADIVIVNEVEVCQLLKLAGMNCTEGRWEEATELLRSRYLCKSVILTLGAGGYLLNENGRIDRGEGIPTDVVDTSGAGDGFLAAVVYQLHLGNALAEACQWANCYASIAVGYSGTIPGYRPLQEVETKIEQIRKRCLR